MSGAKTDPPTLRRLADSVGFDDGDIDFAEQLDDQLPNDGGFADRDAGIVYAVARINNVPIRPGEVADASQYDDVDADTVVNDTRRIADTMPFDLHVDDPSAFVKRFVDDVSDVCRVPDGFRQTALRLCADATNAGLQSGKSRSGFAASVVYAASVVTDADIGQYEVADIVDVSPVTIRNQYRPIIDCTDEHDWTMHDADDLPELVDAIADDIDRVPDDVRDDAVGVAESVVADEPEFVTSTKVTGTAGGVFYVVAERHRFDVSMQEVADTAGVSKHTVVARVHDVRDYCRRVQYRTMNYNRLKELAASHDLDVGTTPAKSDIVDALVRNKIDA